MVITMTIIMVIIVTDNDDDDGDDGDNRLPRSVLSILVGVIPSPISIQ